jgi:TetR/AcrR family transcriptional regulator, regulator of mycofactocin system
MFTERGFDATTIEQIAPEAGVSERTFFRYFTTKASVLWSEFETEVETIRSTLAAVPDEVPMMDAIRRAVVAANHYRAEDVPEMRLRMNLIATVPALSFSAAEHYESWEQAIREFAGRRLSHPRSRSTRWRWGGQCSPRAGQRTTAGQRGLTPT